jgi:hypothetical protein
LLAALAFVLLYAAVKLVRFRRQMEGDEEVRDGPGFANVEEELPGQPLQTAPALES